MLPNFGCKMSLIFIFSLFCIPLQLHANCFIRVFLNNSDHHGLLKFNPITESLFPSFPLWSKVINSNSFEFSNFPDQITSVFRFTQTCHIFHLFRISYHETLYISDHSGYANLDKAWFILTSDNSFVHPFDWRALKFKVPIICVQFIIPPLNPSSIEWKWFVLYRSTLSPIIWQINVPINLYTANSIKKILDLKMPPKNIVVEPVGEYLVDLEFFKEDLFVTLQDCSQFEPIAKVLISSGNFSLRIGQQSRSDIDLHFRMINLNVVTWSDETIGKYLQFNVIFGHMHYDVLRFVYCKVSDAFLVPEWGVFLKPFETATWSLLFVLIQMMVVILLVRPCSKLGSADYVVVLLSAVVYILSGQKSRYLVTLMPITFSLGNIILNNMYFGAVTTDFISKPVQRKIDNVSGLLQDEGYRYENHNKTKY